MRLTEIDKESLTDEEIEKLSTVISQTLVKVQPMVLYLEIVC